VSDYEGMRNRPRFDYEVLERTNHFYLNRATGQWLRECRVRRLSDGVTGRMGIPAVIQ
jgi:hypothetical protein